MLHGVIEYDDAAVADHCADFDKGLVVQRRVELFGRNVGAELATDLHGLDRTATGRAAAPIIDELPQRDAERLFDEPAALRRY